MVFEREAIAQELNELLNTVWFIACNYYVINID